MPKLGYYEMGTNNAVCDQCGRAFKSNQLKKRWDNAWTCGMCWEPRHPQDFIKGIKDNQAPTLDRPRAPMPQYYLSIPDANTDRTLIQNNPMVFLNSDLDIRAKIRVPNWSTSFVGFAAKAKVLDGGTFQNLFFSFLLVSGPFQFYFIPNSSQIISYDSTASTGFSANTTHWVRATVDLDNGSNSVAKFYTSEDYDQYTQEGTWTQLGASISAARITTVDVNQESFTIGTSIGGGVDVFYVEVRSGIDGNIAYSFDPNNVLPNGKVATDNGQFEMVGNAEVVEV